MNDYWLAGVCHIENAFLAEMVVLNIKFDLDPGEVPPLHVCYTMP
jgi:hypothetical protein